MNSLERAIRDMEEARESHVVWLRDGGDPTIAYRDTVKNEALWVRRYDNVLRLLHRMEQ